MCVWSASPTTAQRARISLHFWHAYRYDYFGWGSGAEGELGAGYCATAAHHARYNSAATPGLGGPEREAGVEGLACDAGPDPTAPLGYSVLPSLPPLAVADPTSTMAADLRRWRADAVARVRAAKRMGTIAEEVRVSGGLTTLDDMDGDDELGGDGGGSEASAASLLGDAYDRLRASRAAQAPATGSHALATTLVSGGGEEGGLGGLRWGGDWGAHSCMPACV